MMKFKTIGMLLLGVTGGIIAADIITKGDIRRSIKRKISSAKQFDDSVKVLPIHESFIDGNSEDLTNCRIDAIESM